MSEGILIKNINSSNKFKLCRRNSRNWDFVTLKFRKWKINRNWNFELKKISRYRIYNVQSNLSELIANLFYLRLIKQGKIMK